MALVGVGGDEDLPDEAHDEARPGDESEARIAEVILVLEVAEQREDDAVGHTDAGGSDEQRIPALGLAPLDYHGRSARRCTTSRSSDS